MAEKLEPCRFCQKADSRLVVSRRPFDKWQVWCCACGALGPVGERDEATRLWNTRKQKEPTK